MPAKKTTEEFVRDAILVHGDKYDYSKVDYNGGKNKVIIICKIHGEILQSPNSHLNGSDCNKCSGNYTMSNKEWIEKAKIQHKDKYDYSKVNYNGNKTKVIIICKIHGDFLQIPADHLNGFNCSKCSGQYSCTNEEWIEKAKIIHCNKYDYSKVDFKGNKNKVIIICKIHGDFLQNPKNHILQIHGCPKCSSTYNYTNAEWIEKAKDVHEDKYDYSKVDYKTNKSKVIIICKIHGEFLQNPNSHLLEHGCNKCARILVGNKTKKGNELFIKQAVEKHGDKYDYSKVDYFNCATDIIIICKSHGEFLQTPEGHLKSFGCKKCHGIYHYTTEEWIEKASKKHGNKYDYSKVDYKNSSSKIIIICKIHGKFSQSAGCHMHGDGCSKCSGKYTYTTPEWIEKANKKHNNKYDYSKSEYNSSHSQVIIICKAHGEFELKAYHHHIRGQGCQKCQLCPSCQLWRTNGKLCGYCLPKNKNKLYQKTKEYAVVKYLKDHLPDYDFIHNQSVGSDCTKGEKENSNGHLYPDIRYDCGHYHLIVEVDEHKHRGADYKCDEQRMYDIIAKLGLPCIFIRYNPDSQESNKEILLQKIKDYLELDVESDGSELWNDYGFNAEYLFY